MNIEILSKIHLGGKSVDCTEEVEQRMNMMINPSGSGSLKQDGQLGIVGMEEEEQARHMHQH